MVLDSPRDLQVYDNGRKSGINDIVKWLISIIYKHVDNNELRIKIFHDIIERYPETREVLLRFIPN
jgi:hypothetical protein